jgi:chromosome segregation ATPase
MPLYTIENKTKFKRAYTNEIGAAVVLNPGQKLEGVELSDEFVKSVSAATDLKFSSGKSAGESGDSKELKGALDAALKSVESHEKTIASLTEQNKVLKETLEESTKTLQENEAVVKGLQAQLEASAAALKASEESRLDPKKSK